MSQCAYWDVSLTGTLPEAKAIKHYQPRMWAEYWKARYVTFCLPVCLSSKSWKTEGSRRRIHSEVCMDASPKKFILEVKTSGRWRGTKVCQIYCIYMYESIQWSTWKALCSTILISARGLNVGALVNLRSLWAGVTFHILSGSEQPEQGAFGNNGQGPS